MEHRFSRPVGGLAMDKQLLDSCVREELCSEPRSPRTNPRAPKFNVGVAHASHEMCLIKISKNYLNDSGVCENNSHLKFLAMRVWRPLPPDLNVGGRPDRPSLQK